MDIKHLPVTARGTYCNPAGCHWQFVCIRKVRELYAGRNYFFYSYPGRIARGTWLTWYVSIRNGYSSGWVDFNSAAIRTFERVTDSGFSLFCGWIFFCCLEMLLSLNIVGITLSLCYNHKISNNALMSADKKRRQQCQKHRCRQTKVHSKFSCPRRSKYIL